MQVIPVTKRIFPENSAVLEERPCIRMRIKLKRWRHLNLQTSLLLYPPACFNFFYTETLWQIYVMDKRPVDLWKHGFSAEFHPLVFLKHPQLWSSCWQTGLWGTLTTRSTHDRFTALNFDHEPGNARMFVPWVDGSWSEISCKCTGFCHWRSVAEAKSCSREKCCCCTKISPANQRTQIVYLIHDSKLDWRLYIIACCVWLLALVQEIVPCRLRTFSNPYFSFTKNFLTGFFFFFKWFIH